MPPKRIQVLSWLIIIASVALLLLELKLRVAEVPGPTLNRILISGIVIALAIGLSKGRKFCWWAFVFFFGSGLGMSILAVGNRIVHHHRLHLFTRAFGFSMLVTGSIVLLFFALPLALLLTARPSEWQRLPGVPNQTDSATEPNPASTDETRQMPRPDSPTVVDPAE
jgi:hypothetical protein